jgi:sugar phosphate isomerase/epimerase
LAALNKAFGICALFQNHTPGSRAYFGSDLAEMFEIVKDLNPDQVGVAFDLGHAINVHGDEWPAHFERLKPHLKIAYVKDVDRAKHFVPFGQGEFKKTDFFTRLKRMNYRAPFSLHIEFDWAGKGNPKTRAALVKTLKESRQVLQQWWDQA